MVLYFFEESYLSVYSLGVCLVLKREEYFFDGVYFAGSFVSDFPYVSVGSTADLVDDFVLLFDVGVELGLLLVFGG